jgi:hypothetical protein
MYPAKVGDLVHHPKTGEAFVLVDPDAHAREEKLQVALSCRHNRFSGEEYEEDPWEFVEHDGKTWNRCRECGLLELWEGGTFIEARALADQGASPGHREEPQFPGTGGSHTPPSVPM